MVLRRNFATTSSSYKLDTRVSLKLLWSGRKLSEASSPRQRCQDSWSPRCTQRTVLSRGLPVLPIRGSSQESGSVSLHTAPLRWACRSLKLWNSVCIWRSFFFLLFLLAYDVLINRDEGGGEPLRDVDLTFRNCCIEKQFCMSPSTEKRPHENRLN